ncbi:MAG: tetratricopeptide repeat protein [Methylobacter sp.]|uniref:tetratricopeptide repeat protein n=1 Tax=Methylobacter sp. TaxID=2051955 RepID=UPI002586A6AF|nr:tetratricopeptide repeat protein [Methylobacter sp.]MCL7420859.1 tetratricopeptide repeat protein [Methylobacter sp.]
MLGLTGNDTDHAEIRELLKKATAQAKEKNYDSAISSLLRAHELMKTCSTEWGIRAYFRVARYHHLAGRYDEALQWLQQLHDNVDADADAREVLYKAWGWRQKGGFAKVSKKLRSTSKRLIKEEIELLKTRQQKIETRKRKIKA